MNSSLIVVKYLCPAIGIAALVISPLAFAQQATGENQYFFCRVIAWAKNGMLEKAEGTCETSRSGECRPERYDLSDLVARGGSYVMSIPDDPQDMNKSGHEITISRRDGAFQHIRDWGGIQRTVLMGECELRKEKLRF